MRWIGAVLLLLCANAWAHQVQELQLWPTIPFIRGQDLCQYQDAYGRSKSQMAKDMTDNIIGLLREGVQGGYAYAMVKDMDDMANANRAQASAGLGMDVLLEGSFKAALDETYRQVQPNHRKLVFFNPATLIQMVRDLRDQKRQGYLDDKFLRGLSGVVWGTYSFSPTCRGDVLVTLHLQSKDGHTYNFQGQGLPQAVMHSVAEQVFAHFQKTEFPSKVKFGDQVIELVGAPGSPISHATSTQNAEMACKQIRARLPSAQEYELLSSLGEWNGGVSIVQDEFWAMTDSMVMAPGLRNPSPVRHVEDVRPDVIHFYCVR